MGEHTERERIARIIDPVAFRVNDGKDIYKPGTMQSSCDDARAKADAILAEHRATIAALVGALEKCAGALRLMPESANTVFGIPGHGEMTAGLILHQADSALQLARGSKGDE